MKLFPWFGKSRARDALHAFSGQGLPEDPAWLDGERVEQNHVEVVLGVLRGEKVEEEAMAKQKAPGCWLCGEAPADSDSLQGGGVALHVTICTEHVQLAARRALVRQLAKMAEGVRERLERP